MWQRVRRTPYQAIAAIFMITITLFVFSIFLLSAATLSSLLSYFETKPQITVFFKETKDKASIDALMDKLKGAGKVATLRYISKDEALRIYQEQNKNDPLLLEMVTADILPASLEIFATSPQYLSEIAEVVKKEADVDEVVYQKEVVDTLISWTATIRKIGIIFILLLFIASFMILVTSVGMKIAYRKDEIEILKLVGATPWYIKRPFVLEGTYYGVFGALLSWFLISGIILYLQPFMASFLHGISPLTLATVNQMVIYIWPPNLIIFLAMLVILLSGGLSIGFFGSLFAVSRYMKY
jgi:cell division transport system permease protein